MPNRRSFHVSSHPQRDATPSASDLYAARPGQLRQPAPTSGETAGHIHDDGRTDRYEPTVARPRTTTGLQEADTALHAFVSVFLEVTPELEFAAAVYGPVGRVERVIAARLKVADQDDLARLRPWLKAQNAQGAAIWCRPAAEAHPWVFLDDLPLAMAQRTAAKYAALVVETSSNNAQVWIRAARDLGRMQRQDVSRALVGLIGADPHAIAEPRWGRAPGVRSGKAGRPWTKLLVSPAPDARCFDPAPYLKVAALSPSTGGGVALSAGRSGRAKSGDKSSDESKREFAYACHAIRAGVAKSVVIERVARRAQERGKRTTLDACRAYAERLYRAASERIF